MQVSLDLFSKAHWGKSRGTTLRLTPITRSNKRLVRFPERRLMCFEAFEYYDGEEWCSSPSCPIKGEC